MEKLITETNRCGDCKHIKKDMWGHVCGKKLMAVIPDLKICYYESKGSCFELLTPPSQGDKTEMR